MGKRLIYIPLESYEERYTKQMCALGGWFDRAAKSSEIDIIRVEGKQVVNTVTSGCVLDCYGRSLWTLTQTEKLIKILREIELSNNDWPSIFFEDFWHPGISALPYIASIVGKELKAYARCHAQSVDPHDFTFPMRKWISGYELGQITWMKKIFTASDQHIDQLVGRYGNKDKFVNVGLPIDSDQIRSVVKPGTNQKEKLVIFTSRWDDEKQPWFFLQVATEVHKIMPYVRFIASTSRSEESIGWKKMCNDCAGTCVTPCRVSKEGYYHLLDRASIIFNCALQDYVSNGLIEASIYGCTPVYPRYLSFPESLPPSFLYTPWNVQEAVQKIITSLSSLQTINLHDYHDKTYSRIFKEIFDE